MRSTYLRADRLAWGDAAANTAFVRLLSSAADHLLVAHMSEDRTSRGLLALVGMIGEQQEKLEATERDHDSADLAWRRASSELSLATSERDAYRDKLYAVVNTAKDASDGKCIVCRDRPIGWGDIGLCSDCRLKSYRHGMPT